MVSRNKLFTEFLLRRGALMSGKTKDYRALEVAMFFNKSYWDIVTHLIEEQGQNQTINNLLRHLLSEPKKPLKCKKLDSNCCEITYPEDFYYRNSLEVNVTNSCCPGINKRIDAWFPQHDELDSARKNPHRKSDFFKENVIAQDTKQGAVIYHDCAFDIDCVNLRYYRKIKPIQLSDLDDCSGVAAKDWDGQLITPHDLDACEPLGHKIVDVAIYHAAVANNEVQFSELKLKEIITNNSIYK